MKYKCEVIQDLLPLYHDGVCSHESSVMVEEHLKECDSCKKALAAINKEITVPDASKEDAAQAWKSLVRNMWFRRIISLLLVAVLLIAAAVAGKEMYQHDQERTIWMNADETEYWAYRLADGRVYVQFFGKDHKISVMDEGPSEAEDGNYILKVGYSKASQALLAEEIGFVIDGDYENIVLAGKDSSTVICRMNDDLPPANQDIEEQVAEYDKVMEHSVG